jgi:hypothetical protein|tara:strand:- start:292 stop:570 length:279 start_codon:yes stop_codon:yes gene_type:complete
MAFTKDNKLSAGRPKGATGKIGMELKIVLEQLAQDLHQSIDIDKLKDSERMKLFVSILPYLMPKKAEIENTNTDTNWLSDFTDEQLNKLLNS